MPRDDGSTKQLGDIRVGSESPGFSATDLHGQPVALSEFRDRKVVVVDFWAMWCGPCLVAMPELQELHDEFGGRSVEMVAVNLGESPEEIRSFLDRKGYTFRVVADQDGSIANRFGIRSIPTMLVIGADGLVKRIHVGYNAARVNQLRQTLESLTEEIQPVEPDVL